MPSFKSRTQHPCALCAHQEARTAAFLAALSVVQKVEEAAAKRPETASLEMLALVAAELARGTFPLPVPVRDTLIGFSAD